MNNFPCSSVRQAGHPQTSFKAARSAKQKWKSVEPARSTLFHLHTTLINESFLGLFSLGHVFGRLQQIGQFRLDVGQGGIPVDDLPFPINEKHGR